MTTKSKKKTAKTTAKTSTKNSLSDKAATAKITKAAAPKTAAQAPVAAPKPTTASATNLAPGQTATPAVVNAPEVVVLGQPIRKKEIVEAVVSRSGLKKRDVKPVVDHLLTVMGDAMAEGRELVVPPLGRVKVHKKKDAARKTIYFAKVHRRMASSETVEKPDDDKAT